MFNFVGTGSFGVDFNSSQSECLCFDLLGKSGESYKLLEEWALAAKGWGAEIQLNAYQDEAKVDQDVKAGKCDAFYMTSMRARAYNKFAGSIDAIGGVPNNDIAMKAISYVLDKRNSKRLITQIGKEKFEVAGIGQIGPAYIFVRDRTLNKLEQVKGKKFAVLHYDYAQKSWSTGLKPYRSCRKFPILFASLIRAKLILSLHRLMHLNR